MEKRFKSNSPPWILSSILVFHSLATLAYANEGEIHQSFAGELAQFSSSGKHLAYVHDGALKLTYHGTKPQIDADHILALLAQLDSNRYQQRQNAYLELKQYGGLISDELDRQLKKTSSREARERLSQLKSFVDRSQKYRFKRRVRQIAFSPDENHVAVAGDDKLVTLWRIPSAQFERIIGEFDSSAHCVSFSPDGRWLAIGCGSGQITVVDLQNKTPPHVFSGHTSAVHSLAFSPKGNFLYSAGGFDQKVGKWKMAKVTALATNPAADFVAVGTHQDSVLAVAVTASGPFLASGGYENLIRLWDLNTDRIICEFTNHQNAIRCLTFCDDDKTLISGGDDSVVRVWDMETRKQIQTIPFRFGGIRAISIDDQRKRIAISGSKKTVVIKSLKTATRP